MSNPICKKCMVAMALDHEEGPYVVVKCGVCGQTDLIKDCIEHQCGKCGYGKAMIIYHASTIGDESTTTIYKCLKCNTTHREGFMAYGD